MPDSYPDLYFTPEQIFLSETEARDVAEDFWGRVPGHFTQADIAFVQRALLIAVDMSEKAGFLFEVYRSFVTSTVRRSVRTLVNNLAKRTARRWFRQYIDDTPKISAVGRTGVQYSGMSTEWRLRVSMDDPTMLTNYLIAR